MAAFSSQASKLQITISGTPTDIPQLTNLPEIGVTSDREDITTLDSTSRQYIDKIGDVEEFVCEGIWDPTNTVHDLLMDQSLLASGSKTVYTFTQIYSDTGAAQFSFTGKVVGMRIRTEVDAALRFTLTILQTGTISYTQ